jgi:hypothetical protein
MRYWGVTVLAVAAFAGCVFLFCDKLTTLLDVGTCASGNQPYVIARECPEGTSADALLLMASVIGFFLVPGIAALRGPRPGRPEGGAGIGTLILWEWAFFFSITGAVALIHSLTSDVIGPDGELGGIIVGVTFLVMGLPALAFAVFSVLRGGRVHRGPAAHDPGWATQLREGSRATVVTRSEPPAASGSAASRDQLEQLEQLDQLERLQRLRESGALTEAEFQQQKARLLG